MKYSEAFPPDHEKPYRDMLQKAAAQLGEHFGSVLIIATKASEDGKSTICESAQSGDPYASRGALEEFRLHCDTYEKMKAKRAFKEPDL